ncbi:hypothetical protein CRUP_005370 [Coryphaenoides rupestris]|nr:hypothetical protein CRUP_005370 [Coryphaenoides rupestris]
MASGWMRSQAESQFGGGAWCRGRAAGQDRPAWDSKLQYVLAQVGFSVGLGNVWRFPYCVTRTEGGRSWCLYVVLLMVIGVPLFFMELAAGQCIRQGSIGVWKHISPKLQGIGYASCVVCFYVALYYNVIIAWSLFYMGNSFQYPLPWEQCPIDTATNTTVKECAGSSPTSYFWFRKALDITDSIDQSGEFNPIMTGCLLAAWAIVALAMIKGIKSSARVMYFSSIFPYVVLFIFLVRGLMLDGAMEGITYMFYPKLEIWGEVQVWRQAATQVFFALGLGYGSVIAYSSYNPVDNNCHRDALMVSGINFLTSVLASLVVFVVLGFRAKSITLGCVAENLGLLGAGASHWSEQPWWPAFNTSDPAAVSIGEYREWFSVYGGLAGPNGVEGTGLAFIAFTEAMALFPASPLWSTLFFLMLLNLGLSTMFGTMQGILTPLMDNFRLLGRHRTALTVSSCALGFVIGLLFTQRSGNYFVTMFDDYSATLPLIIVVVFLDDIEVMLKWRPPVVYKYMWKYVCLLSMASEATLRYPGWALALIAVLILVATLPVPVGFVHAALWSRAAAGRRAQDGGLAGVAGDHQEVHREMYTKCKEEEEEDEEEGEAQKGGASRPRATVFLSAGSEEHYRLLPQREEQEEEQEEDTVL